jgi:hypothetical protein
MAQLEIWKLRGAEWGMEGEKCLLCAVGGRVPCIVEMPQNLNVARGAPEQQMAKRD